MRATIGVLTLGLGLTFGTAGPAPGADLGGDCCADLEQRVAVLEATSVHKGNRKVELTITGTISAAVLSETNNFDIPAASGFSFDIPSGSADIVQNPIDSTVIAVNGVAKVSKDIKIGFAMELMPAWDDGKSGMSSRDTYVYVSDAMLGQVSLGYQQAAGDGPNTRQIVSLDDVSGLLDVSPINHAFSSSLAVTPGVSVGIGLTLPNIGFQRADSVAWHIDNIGKSGVGLAASYAPEGHVFGAAATFGTKIGTVDILAGAAYENQQDASLVSAAVSGGIREEKSGLFAQGAYEKQTGTNTSGVLAFSVMPTTIGFNVPINIVDLSMWQAQGGISQGFFKGVGDTTVYGEYGKIMFSDPSIALVPPTFKTAVNFAPTFWGIGVRQNIDSAASDVFAGYRNYSLDDATTTTSQHTISTIIAGVTVHF